MPKVDVQALVEGTRVGDLRSASRLIRLIDDDHPDAWHALKQLFPHTGHARVIGITGPPGAGKSTTTNCLIQLLRHLGKSVGVLAVDPSSPITGGAILGDRIRMKATALDKGVFVRSLASRGYFGGVTPATRGAIRVMDAMGKDYILVETVGVGQDEVDIARLADTTVIVWVPGLGDDVQAMKAGILEVGDVFVVNKADHPDADATVSQLKNIFRRSDQLDWVPPVVKAEAVYNRGIAELFEAVSAHEQYTQQRSETWLAKQHHNYQTELREFLRHALQRRLNATLEYDMRFRQDVDDLISGAADIYQVTDTLLETLNSD